MTKTEDVTVQVNGVRTEFTATDVFEIGSLEVHLNGVRLQPGENFEELTQTTFRIFEPPEVGDTLLMQAEVAGPGDTLIFPTVVASGIDPARW